MIEVIKRDNRSLDCSSYRLLHCSEWGSLAGWPYTALIGSPPVHPLTHFKEEWRGMPSPISIETLSDTGTPVSMIHQPKQFEYCGPRLLV